MDAWARKLLEEVAEVVRELEAVEGCCYVTVLAAGPPQGDKDDRVDLVVTASLDKDVVYSAPVRSLTVQSPRLCWLASLTGPRPPIDAQLEPIEAEIEQGADYDHIREALSPFIALPTIRRLGSRDLSNRNGKPLRPRLTRELPGKLDYRMPRQVTPAFTDMTPDEFAQLVEEAVNLARVVRADPKKFWPLLPHEVEQVLFPKDPIRRRARDYDATRELARSNSGDGGEADRHDLQRWRPVEVAGRDLVLLRLGWDLTDSSFKALRQALDRHRRTSHKSRFT